MTRARPISWSALLAACFAAMAVPPPQARGAQVVQIQAHWSADQARPGDQRVLAIVLDVKHRYHINPGPDETEEPYIATTVGVEDGPESLRFGPVQYPPPRQVKVHYTNPPGSIQAFEGRSILYLPVVVRDNAATGRGTFDLAIVYQACDDRMCYRPQTETLGVSFELVDASTPIVATPPDPALFGDFDTSVFNRMLRDGSLVRPVRFDVFGFGFSVNASTGFGFALLLLIGAAGGALLNFTPCVLPVIPIKIMSLSQSAGDRARTLRLGVSMSLGVVAFWLLLGVLIAAVSGFTAANQLFQYPAFTIVVGLVIAVMAVGMCGVFAIRLPRFVYAISPRQESVTGSFGFGIMTAVLSTPCTAPFMGAAAAWAATQSPATTLITFGAIGTGMALPYLILSALPGLIGKVPRSGPGSEILKQVMGLLMLAAAAFFVGVGVAGWVVNPPDPPSAAYWWPVMGMIAVSSLWLVYGVLRISRSAAKSAVVGAIGAAAVVLSIAGAVRLTDRGPIDWVYYTPERFADSVDARDVVVMDFTAEWCLNCKAIEQTVLHHPTVVSLFDQEGVVPMKVDLTGNNPAGNAMLERVGYVTIPALVVFSADGRPVFKSDYYTVQQVLDAAQRARGPATRLGP